MGDFSKPESGCRGRAFVPACMKRSDSHLEHEWKLDLTSAAQRITPLADLMRTIASFVHDRAVNAARVVLAGLLFAAAGCGAPPHEPVKRVILISCDTLRADRLGMYGYERAVSPNLDAFAKDAVVFDRAYGTAPHTNPALSSLLTSRLPDELGVSGGNRKLMPAAVRTLPEMLRDGAISSAAIVSNWALRRPNGGDTEVGIGQGFAHFDDEMGKSSRLRKGHFERTADATTDAAIAWLEDQGAKQDRYFLWVHYQDPHGPYTPPDAFKGTFQSEQRQGIMPRLGTNQEGLGQIPHYQIIDGQRSPSFYKDRYDEEIRYFDHELGRLLDWLEAHQVYDDSLVVFTADHGESLGEHNYWFTHEANLYDEEVRVPLAIRYPADFPRPKAETLVGHLDFVPSVLDAFGLPEELGRGVSLISDDVPTDRVMPHSLHPLQDPRRWFALTDARYRLVIPRSGAELYDLKNDPGELRNLAPDQPDRVEDMIARFKSMMSQVRPLSVGAGVDLEMDDDSRRALEALGYLQPDEDAKSKDRSESAPAREGK